VGVCLIRTSTAVYSLGVLSAASRFKFSTIYGMGGEISG